MDVARKGKGVANARSSEKVSEAEKGGQEELEEVLREVEGLSEYIWTRRTQKSIQMVNDCAKRHRRRRNA